MAPRLQDDRAGGFILRVQGIQTDETVLQVQRGDQFLLGHWNLVGLFIHQSAAQVVLAGHGDRGENGGAAAMVGLFAIHDDEVLAGCGSSQQALDAQQLLVELGRVDALQEAAEGGLGRRRVSALGITSDAQGTSLALVEAAGEFLQVGLAARGFTQQGQEDERRQAEQGIGFHPLAIFGQAFEVIDYGPNFLHPFGAAGRDLGFDDRQVRLEMLGLETAAAAESGSCWSPS